MALQQSSTSLSKERFLEKKIQILDNRLTLVEKFIDLRFRAGIGDHGIDEEDDVSVDFKNSSARPNKKHYTSASPDSPCFDFNFDDTFQSSEGGKEPLETMKTAKMVNRSTKKRIKPSSAFEKKKKLEELAGANNKPFIKNCYVYMTRSEIPKRTSSGRVRRAPKRFVEEEKLPKLKIKKKTAVEDVNVIKVEMNEDVERCETPVVDYYCEGTVKDSDSPIDKTVDFVGKLPVISSVISSSQKIIQRQSSRKQIKLKRKKQLKFSEGSCKTDNGAERTTEILEEKALIDNPTKKALRMARAQVQPTGRSIQLRSRHLYKKKTDEFTRRKYAVLPLSDAPTDLLACIAEADPSLKLCNLCNRHFKLEAFEAHLEVHAKERHLKCPECGKAYFNHQILKKHMRIHEPEKYAKKCRQCNKPFVHFDKLLSHERYCVRKALENKEHVDPEFIEDLKNRSRTDTSWIDEALDGSNVKNPDPDDNPDERKECPYCQKRFKATFIQKHLKSHSSNRVKNWSCHVCDKAYFYKHDLLRHVATEHVSNHKCDFCEETFPDRTTLKIHLTPCRREYKRHSKTIKNMERDNPMVESDIESKHLEGMSSKQESDITLISESVIENQTESEEVDESLLFDVCDTDTIEDPKEGKAVLELVTNRNM